MKIIKRILVLIGLLVLVIALWVATLFHSMPEGQSGPKAEELTDKMLASLNHQEFRGITEIEWTFRGKNTYRWDRSRRIVEVRTKDYNVKLNFSTNKHELVSGEFYDEIYNDAIANFYNDAFWLIAPFKIRDTGTTRKYVETGDGPGILVSYSSGGVTPGDSYLWVLDENYRPKYWRLWTSNVPIKGMKFEWANWHEYKGVWLAPSHPGPGPIAINITDLSVK